MLKRLMALFCWLLAGSTIVAQETGTDTLVIPKKEWLLKISPLAVFETDGGIGFSGEYILPKMKTGLQLELQPILWSAWNTEGSNGFDAPVGTQQSGMPLGIKLRPEIRYYFEGARSKPYHPHIVRAIDGTPLYHKMEARTYIAIDFLYKQTWAQRRSELSISNGGTQPVYRQTAVYTDVKQVMGGDIKLGNVFSISQRNRWWMEVYIGLGLRTKKFWYHNLPAGASNPARSTVGFPRSGVDNSGAGQKNLPSFPAGVKLVHRF